MQQRHLIEGFFCMLRNINMDVLAISIVTVIFIWLNTVNTVTLLIQIYRWLI